jgi:hypothetical protein
LESSTQAPEIQQMYSLNMPVSAVRTKMRQEFERHRYVAQLKTVDVLLFNSHSEFQVRFPLKLIGNEQSDVAGTMLILSRRRH